MVYMYMCVLGFAGPLGNGGDSAFTGSQNGGGAGQVKPDASQQQQQQGVNGVYAAASTNHSAAATAASSSSTQDTIVDILKAVLPTVTSHEPTTVTSESIASFNNFMELSSNQLTDWVDFLKRDRGSSVSPNNSTLNALQRSTQQFNPDYWLKPQLPDENIFFAERHRQVLDQITSSYTMFIETGHKINMELTYDFYVS